MTRSPELACDELVESACGEPVESVEGTIIRYFNKARKANFKEPLARPASSLA